MLDSVKSKFRHVDSFSLICAMQCHQAVTCNLFRIDSGLCTFGYMAPNSAYNASMDSGIEVYIKSIFHISLF